MTKIKRTQGITLIALIITIVIMLILASVTIGTINGGLFEYAGKAKKNVESSSEKEILQNAIIMAKEKGILNQESLRKELNNYNVEVLEDGTSLIVNFKSTNNFYKIDSNEKISYLEDAKPKTFTLICVNSQNTELIPRQDITAIVIRNNYSITLPEVAGYVPKEEKIEGTFDGKSEITALYYMLFNDDTTLVFTGLDASGKATQNEAEIVSYMVGDGTTQLENGLIEQQIMGILEIPDTYNGKPVTVIGKYAFYNVENVIKANTGNNVKTINIYGFRSMENLKELVIGKQVSSMIDPIRNCINIEKITFLNESGNCNDKFCFQSPNCKFDIEGNDKLKVVDNILYSADGKKLLICHPSVQDITILDTVETIGGFAFYGNSKITSIAIPDSVTTIGQEAFADMKNLKEITIGKNVTTLGNYAFRGNTLLETVNVNSKTIAKDLKETSSLINYANTIYIKDDITTIGSYVTDNFIKETSDRPGYVKYIKKQSNN